MNHSAPQAQENEQGYRLAIDTSGRGGTIALGKLDDEQPFASAQLPQLRRHNVELIPTIDGLLGEHSLGPADLRELCVAIGPGSFTGLRVGLATAKMLAFTLPSLRVIGVPSLDALALRAMESCGTSAPMSDTRWFACCLALKRETVWCAVYKTVQGSGPDATAPSELSALGLERVVEPAVRSLDALVDAAKQAGWDASQSTLSLAGDPLPEAVASEPHVEALPASCATSDASCVYRLGYARSRAGLVDDADRLAPLYARQPEAVTLWDERHGPETP